MLDDLIYKVSRLNARESVHKNFFCFEGKNGKVADFLEQFEQDLNEEVYLEMVRNHLSVNALKWFRGGKHLLFNSKEEFKFEFSEMFASQEARTSATYIKKLTRTKLRIGALVVGLLELLEDYYLSKLSIKDVIEVAGESLKRNTRNKLQKSENWKELLKIAKKLDDSNRKDLNANTFSRRTPGLSHNKDKKEDDIPKDYGQHERFKEFRCNRCKEKGHFKRDCPSRQGKAMMLEATEVDVSGCPRIWLQMGGRKILALLDTGASSDFISYDCAKMFKMEIEECNINVKLGRE